MSHITYEMVLIVELHDARLNMLHRYDTFYEALCMGACWVSRNLPQALTRAILLMRCFRHRTRRCQCRRAPPRATCTGLVCSYEALLAAGPCPPFSY